MAHGMSNFYAFGKEAQRKCPVCGEMFKPAEEHSYHIEGNKEKLVCTYSCMRKWQTEKGRKRTPGSRGKNKGKHYGAVRIVETGEVFENIKDCAAYLDRQPCNVYQAIISGCCCSGYHIEEVKEGESK